MGKIHWSITAQRNLEDIGNYIAQDSPFYAIDFVERILQCTEKAGDFPNSGRAVPEFKRKDIREMIFHNYRIVYMVKKDHIYVAAVCHGSMDIIKKAKKEDWEIN